MGFNNLEAKFGKKAPLKEIFGEFAYGWKRKKTVTEVVNIFRKTKINEIKIKEALMALTQFTKCLCVLDMLALFFFSVPELLICVLKYFRMKYIRLMFYHPEFVFYSLILRGGRVLFR